MVLDDTNFKHLHMIPIEAPQTCINISQDKNLYVNIIINQLIN